MCIRDSYLIPQKLAVEASPSNLKQLNEKLKQQAKKEAKLLAEINSVIAVLKNGALKIGAKTGTSGKIFGSVTSVQIARAVSYTHLDVYKRQGKNEQLRIDGDFYSCAF